MTLSTAIMRYFYLHLLLCLLCLATALNAAPLNLFPIEHYDQSISHWLNPHAPDYQQSLLSPAIQQQRMAQFIAHYVGNQSPWDALTVTKRLQAAPPNDFKSDVETSLRMFSNDHKPTDEIGYGENFRPYPPTWIAAIAANIDLKQLDHLSYEPDQRGITVANCAARILPTQDPHFYSADIAGQGYPFDNLQLSSLWVATPVYIVSESRDHAWLLVLTADYSAWVPAQDIARVDDAFVARWTQTTNQQLMAITKTHTTLVDVHQKYLFTAYVGTVLPATEAHGKKQLLVPVMNANHQAEIQLAMMANGDAVSMPLSASPQHFAQIIGTLKGRPYGWGGYLFLNDCSQELKSLFTPFGIWLPRHSSAQLEAGHQTDLSSLTPEARLQTLLRTGKPLLTLIYVGGHVMLYVGAYANSAEPGTPMALTYQDAWGLKPHPPTRRAVIGEAVFFPLLLHYPEDATLVSQAAQPYFQLSDLSEMSVEK